MKKNLKIIPFLLIFLLTLPAISSARRIMVTKVYTGDTLRGGVYGMDNDIRLVGIDAPEISNEKNKPGQPYSQEAAKYLSKLILNRLVEFKRYGSDRQNRFVGEIYLDDKNINLEMVKAGLAEAYQGMAPQGFDLEPYRQAEEEAKKAKRGMWSLGDKYVSPNKWRQMQTEENKPPITKDESEKKLREIHDELVKGLKTAISAMEGWDELTPEKQQHTIESMKQLVSQSEKAYRQESTKH